MSGSGLMIVAKVVHNANIECSQPRGQSLPRHVFRNGSLSDESEHPSPLTPLAFNDIPPIPIFAQNRRYRHQPQDSGVTQNSSTSSSLYPKSTTTDESFPSLPSLPSNEISRPVIINVDMEPDSYDEEVEEMDADDVSFRLRLLMQNNYYLPPAHAKPFNDYASLETPKKSPKAASPTFFDLFKVGKKRSTEKVVQGPAVPILRTTSDMSTLSGLLCPERNVKPAQQPMASNQPRPDPRKGRVVVVRERMEDIEVVAKQVEQDLKLKEAERRMAASERSDIITDQDQYLDPTDSVDLPPTSANNLLAPRASLLGDLSLQGRNDASGLADNLQPSSPGIWSVDSEEVAWRTALLRAAVDHSLSNSPVATPSRTPPVRSPNLSAESSSTPPLPTSLLHPADSPRTTSPMANLRLRSKASVSSLGQKRDLGQRIITQMIDENIDVTPSPAEMNEVKEVASRPSGSTEESGTSNSALGAAEVPVRASSPTVQTLPLLPPPRRTAIPTVSSVPSYDVHEDESADDHEASGLLQVEQPALPLRLSDAYESHVGLSGAFGELTPPATLNTSVTLANRSGHFKSTESLTSGSRYSDDPDATAFLTPREGTQASTPQTSRPSISVMTAYRASSDYSESSRTSTEFRDAFDHTPTRGCSSPSVVNTLGARSRSPSYASDHDHSRTAMLSPPPRVSSSLAHAILPAPPRRRRTDPLPLFVGEEEEYHTPIDQPQEINFAVAGASFIEFFDTVEAQHSGVEDGEEDEEEESGDENLSDGSDSNEDSDEDDRITLESAVSEFLNESSSSAGMVIVDPLSGSVHNFARDPKQPLGSFTPQGNMSSPQLHQRPPTTGHNIASKHHSSIDAPLTQSPFDAVGKSTRPQTASSRIEDRQPQAVMKEGRSIQEWQEDQDRQDKSVRRLDGMLIEHMEREKEVLRRITTTLSKNP